MHTVKCDLQFKRGDIVVLKAMTPEHGEPCRMTVSHWQITGGTDTDGMATGVGVCYFCRVLSKRHTWSNTPQQTFDTGQRLTTGEVLLHEWELELYVEPAGGE